MLTRKHTKRPLINFYTMEEWGWMSLKTELGEVLIVIVRVAVSVKFFRYADFKRWYDKEEVIFSDSPRKQLSALKPQLSHGMFDIRWCLWISGLWALYDHANFKNCILFVFSSKHHRHKYIEITAEFGTLTFCVPLVRNRRLPSLWNSNCGNYIFPTDISRFCAGHSGHYTGV